MGDRAHLGLVKNFFQTNEGRPHRSRIALWIPDAGVQDVWDYFRLQQADSFVKKSADANAKTIATFARQVA